MATAVPGSGVASWYVNISFGPCRIQMYFPSLKRRTAGICAASTVGIFAEATAWPFLFSVITVFFDFNSNLKCAQYPFVGSGLPAIGWSMLKNISTSGFGGTVMAISPKKSPLCQKSSPSEPSGIQAPFGDAQCIMKGSLTNNGFFAVVNSRSSCFRNDTDRFRIVNAKLVARLGLTAAVLNGARCSRTPST